MLQRPCGEILHDNESFFAWTDFTWLGWYSLQTTLRENLPDTALVHLNRQLVDFDEDLDKGLVNLHFADGGRVQTRILIGADGYHSIVRQKTVNDGKPTYTGTMTWRGVLDRASSDDILRMEQFLRMKDGVNLSIIGDQKNFWVMDCGNGKIAWTGTGLKESSERSESAKQAALAFFKGWPPIVENLIRSVKDSDIAETGVFDRDPVDSWGVSKGRAFKRVTLLGDAAHPMRPSLGLGSTMAFQDALSLAVKLTNVDLEDTDTVANALEEYEQERIEVTAPLQVKAREAGEQSSEDDRADQLKRALDASLAAKQNAA